MKTMMNGLLLAAAVSWPLGSALAAGGAGQAVAVVDRASASGTAGDRALAAGSEIFVGDTIATDGNGEAQLKFQDGTRMVVGSGSSLVIDQALFRGSASENKFAVRALGGAFRFISGESGDKNFSIRTPSATIGVRGTTIDIVVTPNPAGGPPDTKMLLIEGEAEMCHDEEDRDIRTYSDDEKRKKCKAVAAPCAVLATDEKEKDVEESPYAPGKSDKEIQDEFKYAKDQEKLEKEFQAVGAPCVLGGLAAAATGASIGTAVGVGVGAAAIIGVIIGLSGGSSNSTNGTNND